MDGPLLNGTIYPKEYKNWDISWESDGDYRHWCIQRPLDSQTDDLIVAVMINPGSLSKDGRELPRDTTLRILRNVFDTTKYGCLVLNLFDLATPKPTKLFERWSQRDKADSELIYDVFPYDHIVATVFAYGDYENHSDPEIGRQLKDRIRVIRESLSDFPVIDSPNNTSGSPKHVMKWQIDGHIREMTTRIGNAK